MGIITFGSKLAGSWVRQAHGGSIHAPEQEQLAKHGDSGPVIIAMNK